MFVICGVSRAVLSQQLMRRLLAGFSRLRSKISPADRRPLRKPVHSYVSGVCLLVDFNVGVVWEGEGTARCKLHSARPRITSIVHSQPEHCHDRAEQARISTEWRQLMDDIIWADTATATDWRTLLHATTTTTTGNKYARRPSSAMAHACRMFLKRGRLKSGAMENARLGNDGPNNRDGKTTVGYPVE